MEFRTKIKLPKVSKPIGFSDSILLLGSCFSENVGNKLAYYKFDVCINPFGILYNPESIANSLELIVENKQFVASDLLESDGVWNSFYHHSRFSGTDQEAVLQNINESIANAHQQLKRADYLLITLGTSWIYELSETNQVVSNCHKIPAKAFNRRRLSVEEIISRMKSCIDLIKTINPNIELVFTVSPIRHLKDGFLENQVSKSTLLLAVNQLVEDISSVFYFPAFEIMMDDLRDYRFYAEDMVHPSSLAVDYIWEAFVENWVENKSKTQFKRIGQLKKALAHKPFQVNAAPHQNFLKKQLNILEDIKKDFPSMDFSYELEFLTENIQ